MLPVSPHAAGAPPARPATTSAWSILIARPRAIPALQRIEVKYASHCERSFKEQGESPLIPGMSRPNPGLRPAGGRGTASRMDFGKIAFGTLLLAVGVVLLAVRTGFAHPD